MCNCSGTPIEVIGEYMNYIDYKVDDSIGILTIKRERELNALNGEVLVELEEVIDSLDKVDLRCLIITGYGTRAFVAGADIAEMTDFDQEKAYAFGQYGNLVMRKIEACSIPTIAAVNGYALGGGCELALACDIRIASNNAVFGLPEVSIGITPGFGGTQRLMRAIPLGMAKELVFTGKHIEASKALEIGLINNISESDTLLDEAMALARQVARNAPIAVKNAKKAMDEGQGVDIEAAVAVESRCFSECFATEDQKIGMSGFLNKKRDIEFNNR